MRLIGLILILMPLSAALSAQYLGFTSMPFSFQGELREAGVPASGTYDFIFDLYDSETSTTPLFVTFIDSVAVENGVFTVELDFSELIATDEARYIEIAVAPAGTGDYAVLAPRQRYRPAPIALRAAGVLPGTVDNTGIADGSIGFQDVRAAEFQAPISVDCIHAVVSIQPDGTVNCGGGGGGGSPPAWQLSGNAGIAAGEFLGTTDDQPLDIRVNDQRAVRYQWGFSGAGAPNITGGTANNSIPATREASVIAGGGVAAAPNSIDASYASIGGGIDNRVTASYGTIPGGRGNRIAGSDSFAAGRGAQANHDNTFVWNDGGTFSSTGDDQFLIDAAGGVGIGTNDPSDLLHVSAPAGVNGLRVQINGTTRFRVFSNGGVTVGVNQSPPSAGLLVQGQIRTKSPQTRWLHIGPSDWSPTSHDMEYVVYDSSFRVFDDGPPTDARAPVHLPHGATVTEMRAIVRDDEAAGNIVVRLERTEVENTGANAVVNMAAVNTNGTDPSWQTLTDASIDNPIIDNADYIYFVAFDAMLFHSVRSVRITYTTPSVID